ncbi:hypothetical protein DL93DRAFT_2077301 [Clavulina sp. PMI_390]|nr:hypothetical protein DL93DRAFT_2077301 [Clavulina sp. PMI_390]
MYADYLRYLLAHTRSHLKRYLGFDPWVYARHTATIVFSHPNKWRSDQQRILRQAAITAGLVIPRDITTRLHFVEEGEAAASFALLDDPELEKLLEVGTKFAVCDAGGSTVDISTYIVRSQKSEESSSMDIAELAPPVSLDAGGIYADMGFSLYLSDFLAPHLAGDPHEYQRMIDDAMGDFERQAKRRFSTPDNAMHVKCGVRAQDIHEIGLRKGTLEIPGPIAADFFQHSVEATGTGLLEAKETENISVRMSWTMYVPPNTTTIGRCPHWRLRG